MVFKETRKPRSDAIWTYQEFLDKCDAGEEVCSDIVAILYPNDRKGFKLCARDNAAPGDEHSVWYGAKQLWFRTIEQAMTALADVPHLNQRVEINISKWQQAIDP